MEVARRKIKTLQEILRITGMAKRKGLTVVTTNGVFDLLHIGHVRYLEKAKSLGDLLIVGVNADRSVKMNKGKDRPIIPQNDRVEMLAALACVDYVFLFYNKTPDSWLKKLKPHIHVKGGDRKYHQIVERETLKSIKTKLVLIPPTKNRSTTKFIKKIISTPHKSLTK